MTAYCMLDFEIDMVVQKCFIFVIVPFLFRKSYFKLTVQESLFIHKFIVHLRNIQPQKMFVVSTLLPKLE